MRISSRQAGWIGFLGGFLVRLLGWTWRLREGGHQWSVSEAKLYVFLHGHILLAAFLHRDRDGVTMISEHRDGEVIAQVVRRLGYVTARGSTTRGGAKAFLQMVKGPDDRPWGLSPDGPRGPRGKVHPGIIQLAAESGRPIWPLGYAVSWGKQLSSWDRFMIPYPFSRIVQHVGDPLTVPRDIDREKRGELAAELERRMEAANQEAERSLANW
jgi:lysophospholipid acyltransferase (LPLAT)-like uncharacterized protein